MWAELNWVTRDVLLALSVPGLYCLLLLFGRRLKRHHGVRLGWAYQLFAVCFALYAPALILEFNWPFIRHLGALTVLLGALFFIALVDRYIWDLYFLQRHHVKVPKFLSELARLIILVVTLFLVLDVGYDQTLKGLLLAPGILAVVLGIAMQDLMGNIIAGVALQIGKPFVHGDWLHVNNTYAEVIEVNWRSTRLRTVDAISIEIPNRDLAKATVTNLNQPTRRHAMRLALNVDDSAPPTEVKDTLRQAAASAAGVASDPAPKVFLKHFGDFAIEYEIQFWMDDHALYNDICDAIRTNIWYSFRRQGLRFPHPVQTVWLDRLGREKASEVPRAARAILRQQPLFSCLTEEQLDQLLPRGRVAHFGAGETIIHQGRGGDSMFILVKGESQVLVERNRTMMPVASLKAGDCFGEMSLLTGEPRSATIKAQSDCEVVEIDKAGLTTSLRENPQLLHQLSELLARRQMATEGMLAANLGTAAAAARQSEYQTTFTTKLQAFFKL